MPIISRGVPAFESGSSGSESFAVDSNYGNRWRNGIIPTVGTPQWLALDLRAVSAASRTNVTAFIYNTDTRPTISPPQSYAVPRDFTLQGNTSSASTPPGSGWVTLDTITANTSAELVRPSLNLSTYGWFRFSCTATNGVDAGAQDVGVGIDLHNASAGTDSIVFFGDSIVLQVVNGAGGDGLPMTGGSLENLLETATSRPAPMVVNTGTGGWLSTTGDTNKATLDPYPGAVCLCFGQNDANNAGFVFSTADTIPQQFNTAMRSMITYYQGQGRTVIVPKVVAVKGNTWTKQNAATLNTMLPQIWSDTGTSGPDLYTLFDTHPELLLADGQHPTYDHAISAGMYLGLTGQEHYLRLWSTWLAANRYGG